MLLFVSDITESAWKSIFEFLSIDAVFKLFFLKFELTTTADLYNY